MTRLVFPWPTIAVAGALVFLLTQILDHLGANHSGLVTLGIIAVATLVALTLRPPRV